MTQKRRARLAYAEALALCEGREPRDADAIDGAVIEEVLSMVAKFGLRPSTLVGYVREPFVGRADRAVGSAEQPAPAFVERRLLRLPFLVRDAARGPVSQLGAE